MFKISSDCRLKKNRKKLALNTVVVEEAEKVDSGKSINSVSQANFITHYLAPTTTLSNTLLPPAKSLPCRMGVGSEWVEGRPALRVSESGRDFLGKRIIPQKSRGK